jgi:hypothetical protein
MIGTRIAIAHVAQRLEEILLDEIKNCHTPFLLDIGIAAQDRRFVEFDFGDAEIAHVAVLACDIRLSTVLSPILFFRPLA